MQVWWNVVYMTFDLLSPGMTLTLNQHDQMFRSAHCPVIMNICTKYQNPSMALQDMERTCKFDEILSIWLLTSRYDLDLEPTWLNVSLCTSSCYCEHLYQILPKSVKAYARQGADTKRDRQTDRQRQTDNQYKINMPPPVWGDISSHESMTLLSFTFGLVISKFDRM